MPWADGTPCGSGKVYTMSSDNEEKNELIEILFILEKLEENVQMKINTRAIHPMAMTRKCCIEIRL